MTQPETDPETPSDANADGGGPSAAEELAAAQAALAAARAASSDAETVTAEPDDEAARAEKAPLRSAVGEAGTDAIGQFVDALKLGLSILPRPTAGITEYGKSGPWTASLMLIGTTSVLFPLTQYMRPTGIHPDGPMVLVRGLVAIIIAHAALYGILFAGLKLVFRRRVAWRDVVGLIAVTQVPLIAALGLGWSVGAIQAVLFRQASVYMMLTFVGITMAVVYLNTALRKTYELGEDSAIHLSIASYAAWLLVFFSASP